MANPTLTYDATIIHAGFNLTIEGQGTPNITAVYADNTSLGVVLANCRVNIQYSNVQWVLNNDNSVTVTGNISSATLVRTGTGVSSSLMYNIWANFNGERKFSATVLAVSSDTYNLNFPSSFSITVPPQSTSTAASVHYFNQWTGGGSDPQYQPDEFTVGLIITNPNPPDYRPGAILDGSGVWQSHNRSGGEVHILTSGGTWQEERTQNGGEGYGNPPSIRKNDLWVNQRKLGKE